MKKIIAVLCCIMMLGNHAFSQRFTHADTLRGSNGEGRSWWDATKYALTITINKEDSSVTGYNVISFKTSGKEHADYFQIDLQVPMIIDSVIFNPGPPLSTIPATAKRTYKNVRKKLNFTRDGNAWFVYLDKEKTGLSNSGPDEGTLTVYYHGKPKVAKNAPWDGGIIWAKDKAGFPFITVACQGLGASVWYPCKDYQGDEPDSASMNVTIPSSLVAVSNGRLRSLTNNDDGTSTYRWAVVNPINSYNLVPYVGKYVHWGEIYKGEKGNLTMDYWVIDSNLSKAKKQFKDASRMMKAFEYWFGPYPFYEDGYKLVEAPHLGMEHQSAVAYGNKFENGYLGRDLSGSGQGLKWDFIIVHESGHEWFGNNITSKDVADMWVHEGFTNYSETLFTEFYYGKKAATEYVTGTRKNIRNDKPIIGIYGVQEEGSGDMYYKSGNMIHTIRQVINNDDKFRNILRGLNKDFYHQTVTTKQIEDYISNKSGIDFSKVFDQYLRTIRLPELEYKSEGGKIYFRWVNCVDGFDMPVKVKNKNGELIFIYPTTEFKKAPKNVTAIEVDINFYVGVKKV